MTNAEILKSALAKAKLNGWEPNYVVDDSGSLIFVDKQYGDFYPLSIYQVIYNHDFTKALWGKPFPGTNIPATYEVNMEEMPAWHYHLQQMVVSPDPIKYLGEHLND